MLWEKLAQKLQLLVAERDRVAQLLARAMHDFNHYGSMALAVQTCRCCLLVPEGCKVNAGQKFFNAFYVAAITIWTLRCHTPAMVRCYVMQSLTVMVCQPRSSSRQLPTNRDGVQYSIEGCGTLPSRRVRRLCRYVLSTLAAGRRPGLGVRCNSIVVNS